MTTSTLIALILATLTGVLAGYGCCRWRVVRLSMQLARAARTVNERTFQRDERATAVSHWQSYASAVEDELRSVTAELDRIVGVGTRIDQDYEDLLAAHRRTPAAFRATPGQLETLTTPVDPLLIPATEPPAWPSALTGESGMYSQIPVGADSLSVDIVELSEVLDGELVVEDATGETDYSDYLEALFKPDHAPIGLYYIRPGMESVGAMPSEPVTPDVFGESGTMQSTRLDLTVFDIEQSERVEIERRALAASPPVKTRTYPAKPLPGRRTRRKLKTGK